MAVPAGKCFGVFFIPKTSFIKYSNRFDKFVEITAIAEAPNISPKEIHILQPCWLQMVNQIQISFTVAF